VRVLRIDFEFVRQTCSEPRNRKACCQDATLQKNKGSRALVAPQSVVNNGSTPIETAFQPG
jgi:hypothetical protein